MKANQSKEIHMSGVGYVVRGVSGAKVEEAKAEALRRFEMRERERESAKQCGQKMPRKIKLKDVDPKKMYHQIVFGPTLMKSSADDAVEFARRSGFLDVKVCRAEQEKPQPA